VNLFYDRARAVQPRLVRSPSNESVVMEIVERLDCLSLAVELAAARVRMLPPEKVLSRLSQRFKLLRGQRRDLSARQTTLRGAIDWSWELLKTHEQSALAQLSVFRGGCTLEAAEAVVDLGAFGEAPWVMDVVEALVDQSLLRRVEPRSGHVRYRMLESIRAYAAEKLGAEGGAAALRHAVHFASFGDEMFLESLYTHGGVERRKGLGLELENLAAGLETALALGETEVAAGCALATGEMLGLHGPFSEGLALVKRVATHAVCRATQGRLFLAAGWLLAPTGRSSEALEPFQQALSIAREVGNRRLEGVILGDLANLHRTQGHASEALEHYHDALAIAREVGNRRGEGVVLGDLGFLCQQQGRVSETLAHYGQALAISREVGDRRNEGMTLGSLAMLHRQQGHVQEAQEHYLGTLSIERELGDRRNECMTLGALANLYGQQGRIQEALAHFHQSLAIHREVGNRQGEGLTLGNLGDFLFNQGDVTAAESHLLQSITICDEVWPMAAGAFRGSLALIRGHQGAFDAARSLFEKGEVQLHDVYALELGKLLCKKARVEKLDGNIAAAAAALSDAEGIVTTLNMGPNSELGEAIAKARASLTDSRRNPDV
jgi:tetratricopeptide (TPR) repeat protein